MQYGKSKDSSVNQTKTNKQKDNDKFWETHMYEVKLKKKILKG